MGEKEIFFDLNTSWQVYFTTDRVKTAVLVEHLHLFSVRKKKLALENIYSRTVSYFMVVKELNG